MLKSITFLNWVSKIDAKKLITESKDVQVMFEGGITEKDKTRELVSVKRMEGIGMMVNTGENLMGLWQRTESEVMNALVVDIESSSEALTWHGLVQRIKTSKIYTNVR